MSQQQSPPHSAALLQVVPPLAALPLIPLDEAATADATLAVLATEDAATELEDATEDDATELDDTTEDAVELTAKFIPPAPPPPESKSVVEPVAQLITMPKPIANAPMP